MRIDLKVAHICGIIAYKPYMRNKEDPLARRIQEQDLQEIEEVVRRQPKGMTAQQIADALKAAPPRRTLQYRLKSLVEDKRLIMEGDVRWARYRTPQVAQAVGTAAGKAEARAVGEAVLPLSAAGRKFRLMSASPSKRAGLSVTNAASSIHTVRTRPSI